MPRLLCLANHSALGGFSVYIVLRIAQERLKSTAQSWYASIPFRLLAQRDVPEACPETKLTPACFCYLQASPRPPIPKLGDIVDSGSGLSLRQNNRGASYFRLEVTSSPRAGVPPSPRPAPSAPVAPAIALSLDLSTELYHQLDDHVRAPMLEEWRNSPTRSAFRPERQYLRLRL